MTNFLNQFYNDEHTREAVKAFFLEQLDKLALEKVYSGEETTGIKDAKETIERAFIELKELYGKDIKINSVNQAR
ncbi:MAG: hypothetical protein A2W05_07115 [Candidatus Schekmanbacteria bacterium RBG_16_38_10]|uniref:Uncharacterized protein n=1 Tax=Candidatus Schekmanbacteria bacterium RBG_16_38_10 TaxID=1817879 RepID=A0A1F7RY16_9BACT|nr:MAG: hypothetical protein A2W05_07115 [Candidatus Schekmanbacteria bacterium RBG_16_38_10]